MEVTILNRQRSRRVPTSPLSAFLCRVSDQVPPDAPASLTVCLVSDRRMRELNARFAGRDSTTDVLSFPGEDADDGEGRTLLGDIVVSVPAAARQARRRGHSFARELKILLLHGYLHLLGYDHETDDGTMLRLQRRLVRSMLAPRSPRAVP